MKKEVILLALCFLIVITSSEAALLESCSIKQSCNLDEILISSVFAEKDAHISKDINRFNYKLCCKGTNLENSCNAEFKHDNLGYIYAQDEAHIDAELQPYEICLSTSDNSNVQCSIKENCNSEEVCIFDMYQATDSHIAECENS